MEQQQLEEAMKSDLSTLSRIKMGFVSARDFYGQILGFTFKLSLLLFAINTGVRFLLIPTGRFSIPPTAELTIKLMAGTWVLCFIASLVIALVISRFILLGQLIKGRLKTEALMKPVFRRLGWVFLGIYTAAYALGTYHCNYGFEAQRNSPWHLEFVSVFAQGLAFIASTCLTWLIAGIELDRLGIGAVFNALAEVIAKAKSRHQSTHSDRDA